MSAFLQAPGFLDEDPSEQFLTTGMAPLPDGEPVDGERRHLEEAAIALGAAFLVMRHQLAKDLADNEPRPDQSTQLATEAWQRHLPLWLRLSMPAISRAMAQRTPGLSPEELDKLALDYCLGLGDYLNQSSAEALTLGYARQLGDRQNEKLSWMRATSAYGLGNREMYSYISGVIRSPRSAEGDTSPARGALDRLLLQRADLMGANEVWRAMQSAKTLAWGLRYTAGQLPAGTMIEWDTREDETTCSQCGPMDHQRVEPGQPFTGPGGVKVACSPLHPKCRCESRLIAPVVLAKAEEPRDFHGRWTAEPELAPELPYEERAPYARPTVYQRPGGRLTPRTTYQRPAEAVEPAPPSPTPARAPYARTEMPAAGPAREPYTRATAQAFGPKPKKAKKPKKEKAVEPAPTGKLIPMPAKPEPTPTPAASERRAYLPLDRNTRDSLAFTGPLDALAPGAVVRLGVPLRHGDAKRAPVEVDTQGYVEAQMMPAEHELSFWQDQQELLNEIRSDAEADVAEIVGHQIGTTKIAAIYRLAGVTPASDSQSRRDAIVHAVERGGGSNLSEAYLDYMTYSSPQSTGAAGHELATIAYDAGMDSEGVPVSEVIVFDGYAEGDSPEQGVAGEYQVASTTYSSNQGITPGYAGRREIHLRPAPEVSKSMSVFGVDHAPASVTGGAHDA